MKMYAFKTENLQCREKAESNWLHQNASDKENEDSLEVGKMLLECDCTKISHDPSLSERKILTLSTVETRVFSHVLPVNFYC